MTRSRSVCLLTTLAVLAAGGAARGQTAATAEAGIDLDRLVVPPGPGALLTAEDAEVLGAGDWSLAGFGSLMSRPLVLHDLTDGTAATTPVRLRLGYQLVAALGIGDRYQIGVNLPVVAAQDGDRLQGIDLDERSLAPIAIGDLRLTGKIHLAGEPGGAGGGLAAAVTVALPTGDQDQFAGERGAVIDWRMIAAWRWLHRGLVAIDLGPRLRTREVVLLSPARRSGNELCGALATEWFVPGQRRDALSGLVEYAFALGDSTGGGHGPSPRELRVGGRWRLASGVTLTAALGFGTSPAEIGSPAWRLILGARFDSAPLGDLDRDGILDRDDRCRDRAEDFDGFSDFDGCPDPDNDHDGIPDPDDECPNAAEDFDRHEDLDGCPDR